MRFKNIFLKYKTLAGIYWQNFLIKISGNRNIPFNKPTSVVIDVTKNCVLHCEQCKYWQKKPQKQLTYEEGKVIIDKLYNWLGKFYLFFTGGEPFINKDLPKIIEYAEKKGIFTHVNSNAFLIDNNLGKKIKQSHLSAISISLDGSNAATHDFLRGTPGTFNKVLKAIRIFKKKASFKKPKVYINSVIMKPNLNELIKLIEFSDKEKTDGITFQCLLPTLGTYETVKQMKKRALWPDFKQLKAILEKINNRRGKYKTLLSSKKDIDQIINYYNNPEITKNSQCQAGINNFIIDNYGNVRLCFRMMSIGNIYKTNPKDIWKGIKAQQQRELIKKCQRPCKIIACNLADTNRQLAVEFHDF